MNKRETARKDLVVGKMSYEERYEKGRIERKRNDAES